MQGTIEVKLRYFSPRSIPIIPVSLAPRRKCLLFNRWSFTDIVRNYSHPDSSTLTALLTALAGPNPWKVAILLEELNVPYTTKIYTTPELKQLAFLALNRNGMAPVIEDPNTHLLLAEVSTARQATYRPRLTPQSGAIMDYVLEQYDTEKRISFATLHEKYLMKQWLQFQTTTYGPILQHVFRWTFTESLPAARAGYVKNFRRVLQVLNDELADKQWLVGNKCSAADLSYMLLHSRIGTIMGEKAHWLKG